MKVKRVKLTERIIDSLKPVEKATWIMDSEVIKLGVRQQPGVRPVYALRWKDADGRDRLKTLWPTSAVSCGATVGHRVVRM